MGLGHRSGVGAAASDGGYTTDQIGTREGRKSHLQRIALACLERRVRVGGAASATPLNALCAGFAADVVARQVRRCIDTTTRVRKARPHFTPPEDDRLTDVSAATAVARIGTQIWVGVAGLADSTNTRQVRGLTDSINAWAPLTPGATRARFCRRIACGGHIGGRRRFRLGCRGRPSGNYARIGVVRPVWSTGAAREGQQRRRNSDERSPELHGETLARPEVIGSPREHGANG